MTNFVREIKMKKFEWDMFLDLKNMNRFNYKIPLSTHIIQEAPCKHDTLRIAITSE